MKPSGFVVPRRAGIVLLLAFACTAPATAHEEVSEKLGTVHFPISCGEHVQRDFNRALAMFYNFWFPNTNKAFEEIARAEPDCVMAYWGFALAQRSNPLVGAPPADAMTRGWEAMQKAKTTSLPWMSITATGSEVTIARACLATSRRWSNCIFATPAIPKPRCCTHSR